MNVSWRRAWAAVAVLSCAMWAGQAWSQTAGNANDPPQPPITYEPNPEPAPATNAAPSEASPSNEAGTQPGTPAADANASGAPTAPSDAAPNGATDVPTTATAAPPPTPDTPPRDFQSSEPPPDLENRSQPGLTPSPQAVPEQKITTDMPILDGHVREGPFLSGPGSLTFILHHTLMAAGGGLATQGVPTRFSFAPENRVGMLAGTLVGAGLGFGVSAYWQATHWIGQPVATYGVVNSFVGGMAAASLMNMFSTDASVLTWAAFAGAELGAWLTLGVGGGEMTHATGVALVSAEGWAAVYAALFLAIFGNTGSTISARTATDTMLLAPGIGGVAMALALLRIHPTVTQTLRADAFGAGVGAVVLLISGAVLGGFNSPTPYVLGMIGSAVAIAAVSLFWDERAEKHSELFTPSEHERPYRNVWW